MIGSELQTFSDIVKKNVVLLYSLSEQVNNDDSEFLARMIYLFIERLRRTFCGFNLCRKQTFLYKWQIFLEGINKFVKCTTESMYFYFIAVDNYNI